MSNGQWKLVPVEPTREMLDAARFYREGEHTLATAYRAMLAAAPDAPSAEPVAWMTKNGAVYLLQGRDDDTPLYALPPDAAAEIARLRGLIDEQKGTIRALNMALGGEDSTSTENLIAAHEIDPGCAGLINICMELRAEVDEYDAALLASDADLMKDEGQAKAIAAAVMADQVSDDSHALFIAAIRDLAAINEALDCDPDDGGAVPIIEAVDELKETIAVQAAALAKARAALAGVCDSNEECEDADGWTAAVISLEALHEAQEALEAIAQLDGAQAGEEGKEPRHD